MVRVFDVDAFRMLLCMLHSMSDNTDNPAGQFVLVSLTQNDKEFVDMLVDYVHTIGGNQKVYKFDYNPEVL